jgi:16S rRNA (cytidine1402-2'-O)-methyltransferase
MTSPGPVLYVVGTPIGNLEDISLRAVRILREVDFIACEDTRKTQVLLKRHGISSARLLSYHKFNEAKRTAELLRKLRGGKCVALVCNAGTPGISDPGARLVQAAIENGVRIEVIPGPSAITAALSISCLPREEFVFCGFIPPRSNTRRGRFARLKHEARTMLFFETANRLAESIADMLAVLGDRKLEIARELTKMHEEVIRTSLSGAAADLRGKTIKGEIVLIVEGAKETAPSSAVEVKQEVQSLVEQLGITKSEAVKLVASTRRLRKQDIYRELAREEHAEA